MKAVINNESKIKFFAQYFGQKVFNNQILGDEPVSNIYLFDEVDPEDVDLECLILKPLSSISDEDLKALNLNEGNYERYAERGCFILDESDYLRSKGYALPWLGLSVEEMVEAGWIKLIES